MWPGLDDIQPTVRRGGRVEWRWDATHVKGRMLLNGVPDRVHEQSVVHVVAVRNVVDVVVNVVAVGRKGDIRMRMGEVDMDRSRGCSCDRSRGCSCLVVIHIQNNRPISSNGDR